MSDPEQVPDDVVTIEAPPTEATDTAAEEG
jgi:hypothetical protein